MWVVSGVPFYCLKWEHIGIFNLKLGLHFLIYLKSWFNFSCQWCALVLPEMGAYWQCQCDIPKPKATKQIQITNSNIQKICFYTLKNFTLYICYRHSSKKEPRPPPKKMKDIKIQIQVQSISNSSIVTLPRTKELWELLETNHLVNWTEPSLREMEIIRIANR